MLHNSTGATIKPLKLSHFRITPSSATKSNHNKMNDFKINKSSSVLVYLHIDGWFCRVVMLCSCPTLRTPVNTRGGRGGGCRWRPVRVGWSADTQAGSCRAPRPRLIAFISGKMRPLEGDAASSCNPDVGVLSPESWRGKAEESRAGG